MGSQRFREYNPDQDFLLPPSLREWVRQDHLASFISDVVDKLDLSEIINSYDNSRGGQAPFHPVMMTKLLLYAYCIGVPSSRRIEKSTYDSIPFRVLSANQYPDHDTISEFRRIHLTTLPESRSGEVGSCRFGWHQGKGQCFQAQGDELRPYAEEDGRIEGRDCAAAG
jgi:transposase